MKMRYKIIATHGTTEHRVAGESVENVAFVEIVETDGLYYVFRLSSAGTCLADTCHMTLDEAVAQAEFEYEMEEE